MSTVLGFEESMEQNTGGREFGREAVLRRLGALARRRREELGLSRAAFVEQSGIRSDATIREFEFGNLAPRPLTLVKYEKALGWRQGAILEALSDEGRRASEIQMEELDEFDSVPAGGLSRISTPELLEELSKRLKELQATIGAPAQSLYGLAAMGHKPEHLDEDGDDDVSAFGPKPDEPKSN